jgi:hypothetical protein
VACLVIIQALNGWTEGNPRAKTACFCAEIQSREQGLITTHGRLGGVMVSVLAIGTQGSRFQPAQRDGFIRAIKMRTPSFGGEVKPSSPCKILRRVKSQLGSMNTNTSQGQIHNFLRPFLLIATRLLVVGLPQSSGGRISFRLSISFHHGFLCLYIL